MADEPGDVDALDMIEVQSGRLERFARVVGRHQSRLFRYAVSRLGCRSLAEDCVQQTFLAVFKGRESFDPSRGFRSWLWKIHGNECSRAARRRVRNRVAEAAFLALAGTAPRAQSPEGSLEQAEAQRELSQLLSRLPDQQADAIRMRYFGELSFDEIASATGVSPSTAKSRVRYGLAKMSQKLGDRQETF